MQFDLTDLRLFLRIVEAGSITHGAAEANLSLASASERLRGMEDAIGLHLLTRGRRGVTPTPAGEALAHHARIVLRQIDHLRGELGEYSKGSRGTIRLLANTAALTEFLPKALAPWLASHPHINIDVKERLSTEIVKAVSGRLEDIGIISDAVDAGALQLRPFAIDRLVAVVPHGHPLAAAKHVAFRDIVQEEFVGLTAGSPLQEHIGEKATALGHPLNFRIRVRTFEGICRIVAHKVGIGVVPETAARRCRRSMGIRSVGLTDGWATRRLSLCFRAIEDLRPVDRDLVEHLSRPFGNDRFLLRE